MADMDELEYLQPGFNPASLTMPHIRSILVSHDIEYPSAAKKAQLIEIFNTKLVPKGPKILRERAHAKRTSMGITNADQDEEEDIMPPPPTPRARSTRGASARYRSDDSEPELPPLRKSRSPAKKTPRPSSKHARASDSEVGTDLDGARKTSRTSRRSQAPTPAIRPPTPPKPATEETPEKYDSGKDTSRRESAFTYDNPFQSGSSPPAATEKKRKSLGASAHKDAARRQTSTVTRRRTEISPAEQQIHPPSSSIFEMPVSAINGIQDFDEHGVEISEEFAPEEQLELDQERAAKGIETLVPRPKKQQARGFSFKGPVLVAVLTFLGVCATWYRQEKLAIGYCDVGRASTEIIPLPDWIADLAEPFLQCEDCPKHAECFPELRTECAHDFVLQPHPFSLGGLVPLPPTCEPDGEKVRKVKHIADRVVETLRDQQAHFVCGDLEKEAGGPEPAAEIDEVDLKQILDSQRRKGMDAAEFEELWATAIGEVKGRDEITITTDGPRTLLASKSLAKIPYLCSVKLSLRKSWAKFTASLSRSIRGTLARYRSEIAIISIFVSAIIYIRHLFVARKTTNAIIPNLVDLTLDRLATQAALHADDPDSVPESWISIGQLRDDVLRSEHSIKKREAVWSRVKKVVEMNANIRASQREARNGEISRAWEWIGAVVPVENGDREARRKSGRISYGVTAMDSPSAQILSERPRMSGKWDEGRPIF